MTSRTTRHELTLDIRGVPVDVIVNYLPGDPGVRTFRNGDPGYPPDPPEVEIVSATVGGVDVLAWVDADCPRIVGYTASAFPIPCGNQWLNDAIYEAVCAAVDA